MPYIKIININFEGDMNVVHSLFIGDRYSWEQDFFSFKNKYKHSKM